MAGQANQRAMNCAFISGVHRLTTPISASVPSAGDPGEAAARCCSSPLVFMMSQVAPSSA